MAKSAKKKGTQGPNKLSALVKWMWALLILGMLVAAAILVLVSFTKMPDTNELENPKFDQATLVYAADGPELGRYFAKNREWIDYNGLNSNLVNALVSTEDERFYKHSGVDVRGTMRAVLLAGSRGGASTITQQLAKLFFTQKSSNFIKRVWQKFQEWVIAFEFEKRYTKEEIITMYLNKYDFLYDAIGISAAAQTYFNKKASDLNLQEAAVLVGMLKNPRLYNPKLYPENAQKRAEVVLKQMLRNGKITRELYDQTRVKPIDVSKFERQSHDKGPAPYFRQELKQWLKKLLNDSRFSKSDGSKYNLDSDGLKIYTTIDSKMQAHAESSADAHMRKIQKSYFRLTDYDPWESDDMDVSKPRRTADLKYQIDKSTRYRNLRNKELKDITQKITSNIEGARLLDADIKRMFRYKDDNTIFTKMIADGTMRRDQRETYLKIIKSEYWGPLQKTYNDLQRKARKEFSRKTKMKVFAHNRMGETDTLMSPIDSIKYHNMHMQIGSMAIEPQTGYVKTWLGGVGFKRFKYDHVTANRQVGSTFKPFIYTTAIMSSYSPCTKVKDQQYTISKSDPNFSVSEDWSPPNSSNKFTGQEVTLYDALFNSLNSASVWLMKEIGNVNAVINLVSSMGIEEKKIPKYPSICLGTPDLSVQEMTAAYATFANKGIYSEPIFVSRIEDANGRLIYTATSNQKKVLSESHAYVMVDMLKHAASFVHGRLRSEFGGKTGTTNDHVDGWFMGVTPNLVVGTWVGGEDRWIRFMNIAQGQGGQMARPFFLDFMKKVEDDSSIGYDASATFVKPAGELGIEIDCAIYDQLQQSKKRQEETPFEESEFEDEFGDDEFDEG